MLWWQEGLPILYSLWSFLTVPFFKENDYNKPCISGTCCSQILDFDPTKVGLSWTLQSKPQEAYNLLEDIE